MPAAFWHLHLWLGAQRSFGIRSCEVYQTVLWSKSIKVFDGWFVRVSQGFRCVRFELSGEATAPLILQRRYVEGNWTSAIDQFRSLLQKQFVDDGPCTTIIEFMCAFTCNLLINTLVILKLSCQGNVWFLGTRWLERMLGDRNARQNCRCSWYIRPFLLTRSFLFLKSPTMQRAK